MNAQIAQVLRTYYRRPVIMLLGVIALLLAVATLLLGMHHSVGGISIAPGFSFAGNQSVFISNITEYDVQRNPPFEVDYVHVTDWAQAPPFDLTQFPNATSLQYASDDFHSERLQEIASMTKLKSLSLNVDTLPAETWQTLGPQLTMLEIPARLLRDHPDEVTQLDRLSVLRIERDALDETTMSVVAKIPNLQTLVLVHTVHDKYAPPGMPPSPPLTWNPSALKPLQDHPHLKSIFVDWFYPESRTIAELPGVVLYNATTSRALTNTLIAALFFSAAISILVALQAWAHFTTQHSVIIPGYHAPHAAVAASILIGGSLVGSLLLSISYVAWLPALVLSLGIPSLVVTILSGTQSPSPLVRALCMFLAMLSGVLIWIPWFLTMTSPIVAGEMLWFFQGELWLSASALFLLEAVILVIGLTRLPNMVRQVYERSSIHPGFSPWDPQQQKRTAYGSKLWWMKFWDRRSFPTLAGGSLWQKAKLWRLGNGYRPLIVMVAMGLTFFGIAFGTGVLSGKGITVQPFFYTFTIQFGMMLLIMPLPIWYKRCRQLRLESLRPVRRSDLIRQLFAALAVDQLWALPILVVAMGYVLYNLPEPFPFRPLALLPLPFTIWLWGFSLGTAVFAIRRAWVLVAYMIAMSVFSFAIPITALIVLGVYEVPLDDIARLGYMFAVALLAASVIVVRTTYKRALAREWGL